MTKKEFIDQLRVMADKLENNEFHFIELKEGHIFGNKNYGEVSISPAKGVHITIDLYAKGDDE